ncbi:Bug family tripartite tricarboxylate transporter substrate binding protein [Zwartia vadi]|uniref:Bug family tripartite tricarboxylate transporter substrate binding protein n=1 Tax=Zwartia vadi TaxID=3058168 RepID=UPI0025B3D29C|nr:tripartite tricarboxylate transporter substrate binding protein [Zwartia vadi]MDN3987628.1 tripartite tricarboxylate transporter substrate binding protein [Zwartia vadi]
MYRKVSALLVGMMLSIGAVQAGPADSYPERPIRIVVPFVAGGGGDFIARAWSDKFSETLKQPVIVENRGGGNTVVGTELVTKAAPDGYTLLLVSPTISTNPTLLPNLPYKTPDAFAPVGQVITYAMGLAVSSNLPINNIAELVAFAKKNPGKLTTATSGEGSATDLAAELFMSATGTQITKIPYKGAGQGVLDVASGHVDMLFTGMSQLKPHLDSQRIKLIATSGAERLKSAPDTPTIAEQGYPGFQAVVWWGVLAPAGTPKEIVAKINDALRTSLSQPEVTKRLAVIDGVVAVTKPAEFDAFLRKEIATWSQLLKPSDSNKAKK